MKEQEKNPEKITNERNYQIEFKILIIRMPTELRKIIREHMRTRR